MNPDDQTGGINKEGQYRLYVCSIKLRLATMLLGGYERFPGREVQIECRYGLVQGFPGTSQLSRKGFVTQVHSGTGEWGRQRLSDHVGHSTDSAAGILGQRQLSITRARKPGSVAQLITGGQLILDLPRKATALRAESLHWVILTHKLLEKTKHFAQQLEKGRQSSGSSTVCWLPAWA